MLVALSVACIFTLPVRAMDWPQWRGPERNGYSAETNLLNAWPQDGPRLLWQATNAGGGFSTPSVASGKVFLLGNTGLTNEFVEAMSAKDGHLLWSVRLGKVGRPNQDPYFPGARSTPTVDGSLLFALGSDGDLVCLETETGTERWRKQLVADFAGSSGAWAYAESPLVDGNALILAPGGHQATILSLNKTTGATLWQAALPDGDDAGYASTLVAEFSGVRQYVQFLATGLAGVDARTGSFLWRYHRTAKGAPGVAMTPIISDGTLFSSTAVAGGALIRPVLKNGTWVVEELYFNPRFRFDMGGVVKVGGYLYGTAWPMLMCLEFQKGEIKWEQRSKSMSWLAAGGRLYAESEDGAVLLVEPSLEGYREKGRFTPPNRPAERKDFTALTYPVLADGKLFIREFECVWCYDVSAGK
jgi:outer membrane protein assembly factor BamB